MSTLPASLLPLGLHIYGNGEEQTHSPPPLYSEYQRADIELRSPYTMLASHWHGRVKTNVPFDGDVGYLTNNGVVQIEQGHITLFWACIPHQLTRPGSYQNMVIFNLPMHLFLSWPLDHELTGHVTHGMVIKLLASQQLSIFEVQCWQQELGNPNRRTHQPAIDEIDLVLKQLNLSDWQPILVNKTSRAHKSNVSRHTQFYVNQMLSSVADNYDQMLTINGITEHVKLNADYAVGISQRTMRLALRQYIMATRINHTRALFSDTDKTTLDVTSAVGFQSSSRFCDVFSRFAGVSPQQYHRLSQQHQQTIAS